MITNSDGPIIYIDDDEEDHFLFRMVMQDLNVVNVYRLFTDSTVALKYLEDTIETPFLILCDVNMPGMDGIELRGYMAESEHLRKKAIPFIFLSTTFSPQKLLEAYQYPIQGFVVKGNDYDAFKNQIQLIFTYWKSTLHPSVYPSGGFRKRDVY